MVLVDRLYTGHVEPGGPAQQRDIPGARIFKISVGPMDNNAYLVQSVATGATVLIDAANEPERLLELVAQEALGELELIVTTHRHADHWQGLGEVHKTVNAPTAAHPLDADQLPVTPDRLVRDGDRLSVGDLSIEIIHLSGHTPGSVALALVDGAGRAHLFTGDSLFPGGVGKTHSAAEFDSLLTDVTTKLFDRYPDDTVVYPGHGDDTTLGIERPHVPEWRARGW